MAIICSGWRNFYDGIRVWSRWGWWKQYTACSNQGDGGGGGGGAWYKQHLLFLAGRYMLFQFPALPLLLLPGVMLLYQEMDIQSSQWVAEKESLQLARAHRRRVPEVADLPQPELVFRVLLPITVATEVPEQMPIVALLVRAGAALVQEALAVMHRDVPVGAAGIGTYPGGAGGKTAGCGSGTTSSAGVTGAAPGGGGSGGESLFHSRKRGYWWCR